MREIDPKIFGPGSWAVIHAVADVCEQSKANSCYRFYTKLVFRIFHALPCAKCRRHAVKYLDEHPIPQSKADGSPFEWAVTFHNVVNKRLKKSEMSLEAAREQWSNTEVLLTNNESSTSCKINPTPEESCGYEPL